MADIKERRKGVGSIKEKHTSVPKALIKQETIHSIQWARQQVQEAAEPEHENCKGAGVTMPRLPISQVKKHPKVESQHGLSHQATEEYMGNSKNKVVSTASGEKKNPIESQRASARAREQGRKLAIHQEKEKAARIKERVENVHSFDSVWEQESETSTRSNPVRENPSFRSHTSNSIRERPASPSVSSTVNLQSAPAEHHEAPPKAIKSADKYKHAGIKGNPHTVKQSGRRVKTPETSTAKKTALTKNQPTKSAAK